MFDWGQTRESARSYAQSNAQQGWFSEPRDWSSPAVCPLPPIPLRKHLWCRWLPIESPLIREVVKREHPSITTGCWPEQVFCPFLACLGMCMFGQGWEKSRLHQKTPPLDGQLVSHVPPWHRGHTRHAPWGTLIVVAGDYWPFQGPTQRRTLAIYNEQCHFDNNMGDYHDKMD